MYFNFGISEDEKQRLSYCLNVLAASSCVLVCLELDPYCRCLLYIIIIHFRSEKDEAGLKNNSVFGRTIVYFNLLFMLCTLFTKIFFLLH